MSAAESDWPDTRVADLVDAAMADVELAEDYAALSGDHGILTLTHATNGTTAAMCAVALALVGRPPGPLGSDIRAFVADEISRFKQPADEWVRSSYEEPVRPSPPFPPEKYRTIVEDLGSIVDPVEVSNTVTDRPARRRILEGE